MQFVDKGFFKNKTIFPLHKCKLCVTTMREIPEETGENHFRSISEEWVDINGSQFKKQFNEDLKANIKREIEIVYEKPSVFAFNKFYMLATRDKMWVWVLEPTED